jgi:peptidoglycan hydrolase CwlO-like protein
VFFILQIKKKEDGKLHTLLGLSWGEWASITTIIVFIAGVITLLFKYVVFGSFQADIKDLNKNFKTLNNNLSELRTDIERLDKRADEHDRRLDRHHERIKDLHDKIWGGSY